MQSSFLQIDVAKIVIHKADQPNTVVDFFDTDGLPREHRAEIDFFAVKTDASAASDVDGFVVERIGELSHATIGIADAAGKSDHFRELFVVSSQR